MKALIVEDDKEINNILSEFLTNNDYQVESVLDGKEAEEILKNLNQLIKRLLL